MNLIINANWPAPRHIHAFTTLRHGGKSTAPFDTFNLATHVGDDHQTVIANRDILKQTCHLPDEPIWLTQTHSTIVLPALPTHREQEADASYTSLAQHICAVMTADCLPILLCNPEGTEVAAIHAGWRGMANGIIENTLNAMASTTFLAWLGPAIGPTVYEVGDEVRQVFLNWHRDAENAFIPSPEGRWLMNLYALARLRLEKQGITQIFGGEYCTFTQSDLFYSYRRDGNQTGRMASLIWFE